MTCVALTVALTAQNAEPQFEVASLKPSIGDPGSFVFPAKTGPGDVRLQRVPLRALILRGYPLPPPFEVANLPKWAETDLYDFAAKKDPGATVEQQEQMFRAFLADRLKLATHYETKDQQGYNLVFSRADRRPGPGLQPTALDCTQPLHAARPRLCAGQRWREIRDEHLRALVDRSRRNYAEWRHDDAGLGPETFQRCGQANR
jgi:uncharacterized protein (TIGR03435 family)